MFIANNKVVNDDKDNDDHTASIIKHIINLFIIIYSDKRV